jgi:hypothetical protein
MFWLATDFKKRVENPEALQAAKVSPLDTLHSNSAANRCAVWFNNLTHYNLPVYVVCYITKGFVKIPGPGIQYTKEQNLK